MTDDTEQVVRLTRTLDAPRDVVWRMWTDPTEFATWYGPSNATVEVIAWHPHAGGARLVTMRVETPGGPMTMRFTGEFLEVTEPERLVYTEAVIDQGHPETRVVVDLHEDGDRTVLELHHHGIPPGSPGEAGWTMALDALDRLVSV